MRYTEDRARPRRADYFPKTHRGCVGNKIQSGPTPLKEWCSERGLATKRTEKIPRTTMLRATGLPHHRIVD